MWTVEFLHGAGDFIEVGPLGRPRFRDEKDLSDGPHFKVSFQRIFDDFFLRGF